MKLYNQAPKNFSCLADKPREKILDRGPEALQDWELAALLLGTGTKKRNVMELAQDLVDRMDQKNNRLSLNDLLEISGIGQAKAGIFLAAMELARRKLYPVQRNISNPRELMPFLDQYRDRQQECFFVISLTGANEIQKIRMVSQGTINRTLVHPREVFADLIAERAASALIAHNHPSGNLYPSPEDREITKRLRKAGELLGIDVLDHIIFSQRGYFSFLEHGEMP